MVKFIGFTNSNTGAPDIIDCIIDNDVRINKGEVYSISDGKVNLKGDCSERLFVACEAHHPVYSNEYATVKGYIMYPGMEFEVTYYTTNETTVTIGSILEINLADGEFCVDPYGRFIVTNTLACDTYGAVRVKVI